MASVIDRLTITDDSGSGTNGTIADAAWVAALEDNIDELFNGTAPLYLGGALGLGRYTTTATGTQNNWDIDAANSNVSVGLLRCNNGSALTINGIVAPTGHRLLFVLAINSTVTFAYEAAGSTAANRISTPTAANVSISAGQLAVLIYDVTTARWRQTSFGADLSNLNATNLTSGTVPDARFPATLPAASGANLTALNASNLASGTVPTARLGSGSASSSTYLRGDGTWAAASGGGKPFRVFRAQHNEPPSSSYATPDLRNGHPVLDFDGSADEEAVFSDVLDVAYAGGGLTCEIYVAFTSATSGSVRWQAAIERIDASSLDIDADSFASFQSAGGTAPGTSGQVIKVTITFTSGAQMDSLAAGEAYRLKIRRDADGTSGTDDITTDAEVREVVLRES